MRFVDRELTGRRRSGESLDSEAKRNEREKRKSTIVAAKAVSLTVTPKPVIAGDPPPRKSRWRLAIFAGALAV